MLTFLINNSAKVYYLFGNGWNKLSYLIDTIYANIVTFFVYDVLYKIYALLNVFTQLYDVATNYYYNIFIFFTTLYYQVSNFIYFYYQNTIILAGNLFYSIHNLAFELYTNLLTLASFWYSKISHLVNYYYSQISQVFDTYYYVLVTYLSTWFNKANQIFGVLFPLLLYMTSNKIITGVQSLIALLPKIIRLTDLPITRLTQLVLTYFSGIKSLVIILLAHAALLATSGVQLINSLYSFIPVLLSMVTGDYKKALDFWVNEFLHGFPVTRKELIDTIQTWLLDNILGLIDDAVERFW